MSYPLTSMRGMLDGGYTSGLRSSEQFPSPWLDMASTALPENNRNALQWCEYIFQANGTYRQAMERIIAYFLTDIEIGSAGDEVGEDEKEKWDNLLNRQLHIIDEEQISDRNLMCYGNDFKTFVIPFTRFMHCPKCRKFRFKLDHVYKNPQFKFKFANYEFIATCPGCKFRGPWNVKDEPENRPEKLKLKSWSPHEIQILNDPFTDECSYLWEIPEDYKSLIKQGKLYHLERVSKQVLDAIKANKMFKFAPNVMFHMKEPALAGVRNRGWGISRLISNFRQVWYVQVLHRYNESIALDYVIPFRLLTPAPHGGSHGITGDILLNVNMGDQMSQIRNMVRRRRRDPAGWNTLGFPVEYQALGGDATNLAPHELLNQGLDTMLNSAGCPVELYKGTLQLQTAPVSLRLFEATWHHLVHQNNNFLAWVVERVSEILNWESVEARHRRVQHADDMQRHMAILQLAMGGQISLTTALRTLGLENKDEQRLIMEEARMTQEMQAEVQEEMEQSAFGQQIAQGAPAGGMPGAGPPGAPMDPAMAGGAAGGAAGGGMGGAPPPGIDPTTGQPMGAGPVSQMIAPGGAGLPTTPEEMMQQAQSIANELLGLPESQKDSELRQLKDKNQVLHDLVRSEMDRIRSQARSQGGAQLMSQQFGG